MMYKDTTGNKVKKRTNGNRPAKGRFLKRKPSWRIKLIGLFTVVLIASLLLQLLYVIPYTQDREVEHAKARQEEIAQNIARELDSTIHNGLNEIRAIAALDVFRTMDIANQTQILAQSIEIVPTLSSCTVMNETGWFVALGSGNISWYTTKSYVDVPFFSEPFEQGITHHGAPAYYTTTGQVGISIGIPITSETGERVGVMLAGLVLNDIIDGVRNYPLAEDQRAYLVDNEGTVVAHSEIDLFALEDGPLSLNFSNWHLVQEVITTGDLIQTHEHDHNGTVYLGTNTRLESNGWGVVVETKKDTILSESDELVRSLWLFNIVLFGIILGITAVFTQQITAEQKRGEEELRKHRDHLEEQVKERTQELEDEVLVRKQAEETMRASEEQFRILAESALVGIFIFTPENMRFKYINPALARFFGYGVDEFRVMGPLAVTHPDDHPASEAYIKGVLSGETEPAPFNFRGIRKDGDLIDCEVLIDGIIYRGKPAVIGTLQEVTERKKAEERIKQQAAFVQQNPAPVLRTDFDGTVIDSNPAVNEIFERTLEGEALFSLLPALEEASVEKSAGPDLSQVEEIVGDKTFLFTLKKDTATSSLFIYGSNITKRKKAEERLRDTLEELTRSNRDLERFAYVASHDLQEPLRKVKNFSELLARRYRDQMDEKADRYIYHITGGATRMQALLSDLLAYSRVATRGKPFESVNCETVLGNVLNELRLSTGEQGTVVTHDPLPLLKADGTQLDQLLRNLIDNAIKFRGEESPRVHVSAKEQDGSWLFSVRDNGMGFKMEYAERIFIVFQRLHSRESYPGTGIGLALSKKIVERHGGEIWVESEPGKGSTFYFTIPVHTNNHNDQDKGNDQNHHINSQGGETNE